MKKEGGEGKKERKEGHSAISVELRKCQLFSFLYVVGQQCMINITVFTLINFHNAVMI